MKVTLRERNQGGKTSLYLDFYGKGKRRTEYLKLYLNPKAKTKAEKEENRKKMELAKSICAKRQIEIQNGIHGFRDLEKQQGSFLAYMDYLARERKDSLGNYGNWKSMIKHLNAFCNHDISFMDVDRQFIQDFKHYLDKKAIAHGNQKLSQNSKHSYFNKLMAALKQAVRDGIIPNNPAEGVAGFKQGETEREFLTWNELQLAFRTECDIPGLKTVFIFSCLTGLRWSDIEKLTWSEVQHSDENGYYIRFRQKKTKGAETLPIPDQAYDIMGTPGKPDEKVFKGLDYSMWNKKVQPWITKAGISKKITFHCARHTYATLQLTFGKDIFTVSKMLGHKDLKTTQVYAKIIDDKKRDAARTFPQLF